MKRKLFLRVLVVASVFLVTLRQPAEASWWDSITQAWCLFSCQDQYAFCYDLCFYAGLPASSCDLYCTTTYSSCLISCQMG